MSENRAIKKVAVLGSGVMGSRLACHFANIGLEVVLLDIVPFDLKDEEKENPAARNRLVNSALQSTLKSNPSPIYKRGFAGRIKTGNFEDDMHLISDADWILEAVIENLEIKKEVFAKVEEHLKPGTLITSNTSGIPIEMMLDGRSDDFKKHFCGTHFFNPPRYLRLLEIIPSSQTDPEVIDFLMSYGDLFLGKRTVHCKDTPAFIANRIGVFSIMAIFHLMEEMEMTVEEIDLLTGPLTGRPKSATFRTCDVVGIDTLVKVAKGVADNCPNDEAADLFKIPGFLDTMVSNNWLGEKSGQGFYKKSKDAEGKRVIEALNIKTMEYSPKERSKFGSVEQAKMADDLNSRLKVFLKADDRGGKFIQSLSARLFAYASNRIPEIADEVYKVDDAIKAGFGWEIGVFETWDVIGLENGLKLMSSLGLEPASWISGMQENGATSFYKVENGVRHYYDQNSGEYKAIPGLEGIVFLDNLRTNKPLFSNSGTTLHDLGDGILNLEFHTKMNSMGGEVLEGINRSIDIAEKEFRGLVIGNEAENFSAGANLAMMFMMAVEQEFDELDFAIRAFQNAMMRCRYSSIPVINTPHGLTLGGGCEMTLHTDAAVAAAETYIGLVEAGIGVIPAGGGTKEMVMRCSDTYYNGDPKLPLLQERFTTLATAKVATSAHEAFDLGILDEKKDKVVINRDHMITEAKEVAIQMAEDGYTTPIQRDDIEVLGRSALGGFYAGVAGFHVGHYASDHDLLVAKKLAFVMAGGDLSQPSKVSEQYLLDLEREAFLSLLGEQKTLERIQSVLKTGRPVRN